MKLPLHPGHPERVCWGCTTYCSADDLRCGNGKDRTQHPTEVLGEDWDQWGLDAAVSGAGGPVAGSAG